jgi:hypothetical protein
LFIQKGDVIVSAIDKNNGLSLLNEFSDVFFTDSLASLPPHRKGFDCEVNFKKDAIPPFGCMYNLCKSERDELKIYVDDDLKKGFIHLSRISTNMLPFL